MGLNPEKGVMQMNTFFGCIIGIGLFIVIGSAGSTDINAMSLSQAIIYSLVGIAMTMFGLAGYKGDKKRR